MIAMHKQNAVAAVDDDYDDDYDDIDNDNILLYHFHAVPTSMFNSKLVFRG